MVNKRICLFLDGVWDGPTDRSALAGGALYRLYSALSLEPQGVTSQLPYYDAGETASIKRLVPGQLSGLVGSLESAYRFLIENYRAGDKIFLFGRSRGALVAHALTAMITQCGLLRSDARISVRELLTRFRRDGRSRSIQHLALEARVGCGPRREWDRRLLIESRRVPIHFVGVWDTVSTLAVRPLEIPGAASSGQWFRCLQRSSIVERAYQALAIDETRPHYVPALWCEHRYDGSRRPQTAIEQVEQRWFPGSHDCISGDPETTPLARRPTAWMQGKATSCGLIFDRELCPNHELLIAGDFDTRPKRQSLPGKLTSLLYGPRGPRRIGRGTVRLREGAALSLNETVDIGALARWEDDRSYRPESLRLWRERLGLHSFLELNRTVYAETARRIPTLSGQLAVV